MGLKINEGWTESVIFLIETVSHCILLYYIIRRLVPRTFTDKCGVTNPLDIMLKTLRSEAGVTDIEITLFAVVFSVLVNHTAIVVFVFS